mmetsp:Transcript_59846/g.142265  ORF Transcript_59846/g.142265 Transcript_59846/m.142265 type:complete len:228 (+) Transcript_59846:711-1394(+)
MRRSRARGRARSRCARATLVTRATPGPAQTAQPAGRAPTKPPSAPGRAHRAGAGRIRRISPRRMATRVIRARTMLTRLPGVGRRRLRIARVMPGTRGQYRPSTTRAPFVPLGLSRTPTAPQTARSARQAHTSEGPALSPIPSVPDAPRPRTWRSKDRRQSRRASATLARSATRRLTRRRRVSRADRALSARPRGSCRAIRARIIQTVVMGARTSLPARVMLGTMESF